MRVTTTVAGLGLTLALTSPVQAVNMFAGPLYPSEPVHCECEIANITATAKTVEVVVLNGAGGKITGFGPTKLAAGSVLTVASGVAGRQYCKFIGASPGYFHAVLACYRPAPDDSDFIAVPGR